MADLRTATIRTPGRRLRVFISSTLGELSAERAAARAAIENLRLTPVMFELGARPHPPRELYRSYVEQSDVFVGIYGESYGWIAPEMEVSGLEDEYALSEGKPRLLYVKEPAPNRELRLLDLVRRIEADGRASYKTFSMPDQLGEQLAADLALMLTERFSQQVEELPSGTVTMLFTDIEGSTQLVRDFPDVYAAVLDDHNRLLREVWRAHEGHEVSAHGDSFFVAFRRAGSAAAAALDVQRTLGEHSWPEGVTLRVRVGLHTGEPELGGDDYLGIDVNKAARVAEVGHGGQILLTQATRTLVDDSLPLRDLGSHRLKDLQAPERLFQLGRGEFPPLATLDRTNLPTQLTPFLGHAKELGEVLALLRRDGVRLLTLTGAGGSGKTRLALQAAAELADDYERGVWWVPLAALRDPGLVLETAAQTLGAKQELREHIADKRMLLLLDNFEHLLNAAPSIADLLLASPNLHLLVTSREPLHVAGEQVYPVVPFVEEEAVGFFLARARAVKPDLEPVGAVGEICRRLDNLPLALELAAARVSVLSLQQILERLEQRLPLLTARLRDAPERQRTLRATIEWSHDLLDEEERGLFARLSVLAGGCTLEAAEEVCEADLDTLQSLVEKSLLHREAERFSMLETIREYALERLEESGEAEDIRRRHAEYFLDLAERSEPDVRAGQQRAFDRLAAELGNLRAALSFAREVGEEELEARLSVALGRFWWVRRDLTEAHEWLDRALAMNGLSPALRSKVLEGAFNLRHGEQEYGEARALAQEWQVLSGEIDDRRGVAYSLGGLANVALAEGDIDTARALYDEVVTLVRELGDEWGLATGLASLGYLALCRGDHRRARVVCQEALERYRAMDNSEGVSVSLCNLGWAALLERREEESRRHFCESLRESERLGFRENIAHCLLGLAILAGLERRWGRATRLLGAADALREETRAPIDRPGRALRDETIQSARGRLGEDRFQAEWQQGGSLGLERAVRYALKSVD